MRGLRFRSLLLISAIALFGVGAVSQVRLAGVSFGVGYTYWSRPFYDPFWWDRYGYPFGPIFFSPVQGRPMGQVRIESPEKTADVYIEGGYAGKAAKLKRLWLDPGVYNFELRMAGRAPEQRRVYVLSDKSVTLNFRKAGE